MLSVGPIGPVVLAIRTITLVGWAITIFAAIPIGPAVPPDVSRLAIGVAIVGTFKYFLRLSQRPATEVYLAGKEMGRRELLAEQAAGDGVVSLMEVRRARPRRGLRRAVGDSVPL